MNNSTITSESSILSIRDLTQSKFVRSVAMLSGGQVLAAAVPLVTAPILGRLYLPSEYGVLGSYMAVSSVLAAVGNWQYAQGIIVEKRDANALVLLQLCYFTSLLTSLVSLAVGIGIVCYPTESPPVERLWFLLLPVSTLIAGINGARIALLNRYKQYGRMATVQVTSTIVTVLISISLGFAGFGYAGLLIAYFVGQLMVFGIYWRLRKQLPRSQNRPSRRRLAAMARKHKDFVLFTTPGAFVGNFAMQMPIYALGLMGSAGTIGLFSRARQLLEMPITLVGSSISQVFQQQAATEYARKGNCKNIYRKTFFALAGMGILPTLFLAVFAPQLFDWFLGPNWRDAGEIARILSPMLFLRLVCSPLSTVFMITGAQQEDFVLSICSLVLTALLIGTPLMLDWGALWIITGFSAAYITVYATYLTRGYQLAK